MEITNAILIILALLICLGLTIYIAVVSAIEYVIRHTAIVYHNGKDDNDEEEDK